MSELQAKVEKMIANSQERLNIGDFNKMKVLEKKANVWLHDPWLHQSEVECKCRYADCVYNLISEATITSFRIARAEWDKPIIITSGFRCQRHNKDIGGCNWTKHFGYALDVRPKLMADLDDLYQVLKKHFLVVIKYSEEGYIHCHNMPKIPQEEYVGSLVEKLDYDAQYEIELPKED